MAVQEVEYLDGATQQTMTGYVIDGYTYADAAGTTPVSLGSQIHTAENGIQYTGDGGQNMSSYDFRTAYNPQLHVGNNVNADMIDMTNRYTYETEGGGVNAAYINMAQAPIHSSYNFNGLSGQYALNNGTPLFNSYADSSAIAAWNQYIQENGGQASSYVADQNGNYPGVTGTIQTGSTSAGAATNTSAAATTTTDETPRTGSTEVPAQEYPGVTAPGATGTTGTNGITWSNKNGTSGVSGYDPTAEVYIQQIYDAQIAANQAALENAYELNVNTINAQKEALPETYQAAKNSTAAQSEIQKANFNEYAASNGLASGTGGQAQLSMTNTLQGNLSAIDTAQANALASLDLQMTNLTTQYQNDLAQAFAEGNLAKVAALYENYESNKAALISQQQFNASLDYNYASLNMSTQEMQYNWAYNAATASGKFSGMAAFGWTQEQIEAAEQQWKELYG